MNFSPYLGDFGRTPYRRLSGGQKQRLGLAMGLIGRPEVVFVNEPTARLDPAARRTVRKLLAELREHGVTVVLTTHYMDEAERVADRIHIIGHGRLIASGTPIQLTHGGTLSTIRLVVTRPPGRQTVANCARWLWRSASAYPRGRSSEALRCRPT